jgi:hypothetical protein
MMRRKFITLLARAAARPIRLRAQQREWRTGNDWKIVDHHSSAVPGLPR